MGGAYGEWTYRAPLGSSRTSGGTALPPATPVGQIYTMYIDFPLDGNTPNPRIKSLKRRLGLETPPPDTPEAPGGPWRPRPPEAPGGPGGPGAGNPPKSGLKGLAKTFGLLEALEAPGGPWRPLGGPGP